MTEESAKSYIEIMKQSALAPWMLALVVIGNAGSGGIHRLYQQRRAPHPGAVRQARGGPEDVRRPVTTSP